MALLAASSPLFARRPQQKISLSSNSTSTEKKKRNGGEKERNVGVKEEEEDDPEEEKRLRMGILEQLTSAGFNLEAEVLRNMHGFAMVFFFIAEFSILIIFRYVLNARLMIVLNYSNQRRRICNEIG